MGYFGLKNRPKIEIFIPTGPGVGTQFTVDLSRKIEFLSKKGSIIGKNARFSVKTDAEAQILYVQREDLVCFLCSFVVSRNKKHCS